METSAKRDQHDKSHLVDDNHISDDGKILEKSHNADCNQICISTDNQIAFSLGTPLSDEFIKLSTPLGLSWSKKLSELVVRKIKLMESFSLLSTIGGGFSALGESNQKFSMRAGNLSLGQQLKLAELLGDERLKVMCHLFAALAALQMDNRQFCINYIKRVIVPMIGALPHCDPIINNILRHIIFRLRTLSERAAIKDT